jgi:hypothetical protein
MLPQVKEFWRPLEAGRVKGQILSQSQHLGFSSTEHSGLLVR